MWSLVAEAVVDGWSQPLYIPLADLAVGWALVASGLVGMIRRPGQVAGGRLVIAGFLWWVGNFAGSADPRIAIIGFAFQGYHDVVLALLVLSFPARWPTRRIDMALVVGLAVVYAVNSVVRLAVRVPGELLGLDVFDQATSFSLIAVPDLLRGVALLVVAVGILGRLFASRGAFRRLVTPVLLAGAAWSGAAALNGVYVPLVVLGVIEPWPEDVYRPAGLVAERRPDRRPDRHLHRHRSPPTRAVGNRRRDRGDRRDTRPDRPPGGAARRAG